MAYDPLPATWFASWSENETNITVPIASFPEMTAGEADAASGDIRKVLFAIVEEAYQHYAALATADKPTKMTIAKSSSVNATTGKTVHTYTLKFYNAILTQDVEDEPAP